MEPIQIFVSYSHVDKRWFVDKDLPHSLIPWLQYVLRRQDVIFWYDRSDEAGLQPGDRFREEIEQNIDRSEIALLLLSDAFFASDFIQTVELPRLLAASRPIRSSSYRYSWSPVDGRISNSSPNVTCSPELRPHLSSTHGTTPTGPKRAT